ncbi:MAG: BspA family leucine-rich repeat surface protein [Bacteroidetes bacterium]|nr:BspA family leucine-rich repeat surface protein [Bacteroidota bacterium]
MRKIYLVLIVLCLSLSIKAQMILEFNTNLSTGTTVTLPLYGTVDVTVDWGDGNTESFTSTGNKDHTYTTDGIYSVSISGTLTQFGNSWMGYDNADKVEKVTSFGEIGLTSLSGAFKFADNLIEVPSQIPSTITDLSNTFESAESFDFDISSWDVQNITNMASMFMNALKFNQDLGSWNTSNVTNMSYMFYYATSFNQDISEWNVSQVTRMDGLFNGASSFNQNIGNWDVSNVTTMEWMFGNATSFDQDLGNWDVSQVTNMENMFIYITLSTANYNNILINWSSLTLNSGISFHAGNSKYSPGEATNARQSIIDNYSWTIEDGGVSDLPAIKTDSVTEITPISAVSGGEVTNNGGSSIINRGIVWNTTPNPTIDNNLGYTENGTGTGSFESDLNSLLPTTTYYVRAYATNNNGTDYGPQKMFTTKDGIVLIFDTNLSDGTTITLPLYGTVDVNVDWGDGNREDFNTEGDKDHTYDTDGIYSVSISGTLTIFGNYGISYNNADKLLKVIDFGNVGLKSLDGAFNGAINLIEVPARIPTNIYSLAYTFKDAINFNFDISSWDVSKVLFMRGTFYGASNFNQNIGDWNVSTVKYMETMFYNASAFNQDIGGWNVSSVENMYGMFHGASNFNQDISNWNVSNVQTMRSMFSSATNFNQDIGKWDVSNVTTMEWMFGKASSFDQDLGNWTVTQVTNMDYMFIYSRLSTYNYNSLLIGWSEQALNNDITFHGGYSNYSSGGAANARQNIIDTHNWSITDGGISNLPAIKTKEITNIEFTSATSGGEITEDAGSAITDRGIVWDIIPDPTTSSNSGITSDGTGTGNYISNLTSLNPGEQYFVRAYATNSNGTDYGNTRQFIPQQELTLSGTYTANNKIYDGDSTASVLTNNLILENVVSGYENVSIDSVILSFNNKNVGLGKAVSISDIQLSGSDSLKYNVSLVGSPTTNANIAQKELTVSGASASDKVYDGTTHAEIIDASLIGTISGDDIFLNETVGSFSDKNVGTNKTVTPAITITGTDVGNYRLTQPTGITADITSKELIIYGAIASDKTYDGTINADITGASLTGIISGDDVSLDESVGYFSNNIVGINKPVTPAITIAGTDAGNYSLTQPTGLMADITAKELTISNASASDKVYDGTTDAEIINASLEGTISGDDISLDELTGTFNDKNAGTDKIVNAAITIKGTDAENYSLIQPTGLSADITEKELTVSGSFTVLDKDYDGTTSATIDNNELILEGTIENDDISLLNEVAEFSQSEVGENITVTIISAELDGNDKPNYTLSLDEAPITTASILSTTGIYDSPKTNFIIYPNPFVDYLRIKSNMNKFHVILTNIAGQKLIDKTIIGEEIINTNLLESGIYFLIVQKDSFEKDIYKVIKR